MGKNDKSESRDGSMNAPLRRIQSSVRTDYLQSHLEWLSEVRRDTGGPGEDAAAAYICKKLQEYGVPVTVHEFDAFLRSREWRMLEVLAE